MAGHEWRKRRERIVRRRGPLERTLDLFEAERRALTFAKEEYGSAAVTDKYADADYFVIKGVSPSGEWTVMFDKRNGKRVVPP